MFDLIVYMQRKFYRVEVKSGKQMPSIRKLHEGNRQCQVADIMALHAQTGEIRYFQIPHNREEGQTTPGVEALTPLAKVFGMKPEAWLAG